MPPGLPLKPVSRDGSPNAGQAGPVCEPLSKAERERIEKQPIWVIEQFYLTPPPPEEVAARDSFVHSLACDFSRIDPRKASGLLLLLGAKDPASANQTLRHMQGLVSRENWTTILALVRGYALISSDADPSLRSLPPPALLGAIYFQAGNSLVGSVLSVKGIPLRIAGQVCYRDDDGLPLCGFVVNSVDSGRPQLSRKFREAFGSYNRPGSDLKSLALSFSIDELTAEANILGEMAMSGSSAEMEEVRRYMVFLSQLLREASLYVEAPGSKKFVEDPPIDFFARPLSPDEMPK